MKTKILSITKKDFDISFFSGSGAGGQHRNRHKNCVRMRHPDSGASSTGADCKSKDQNMKNAFKRLVGNSVFKNWLDYQIAKSCANQAEVEEAVDNAMQDKNLIVEYL